MADGIYVRLRITVSLREWGECSMNWIKLRLVQSVKRWLYPQNAGASKNSTAVMNQPASSC